MNKRIRIHLLTATIVAGGVIGVAAGTANAQIDDTVPADTEQVDGEDAPGRRGPRGPRGPQGPGVGGEQPADAPIERPAGPRNGTPSDAAPDDAAPGDAAPGDEQARNGARGDRGPRGDRGRATADLIGIDVEDLRTALGDGQTLAEIAIANGVDPQTIIDAKVARSAERLDAAVTAGNITAEEAAERLADATERITTRVNEGPGERHARMPRTEHTVTDA